MKKLIFILLLCLIPFVADAGWILKDDFSTPLAAGSVHGTNADIGGARTVVDTYATTELVVNGGFETTGAGGADAFGTWAETAGDGAIADEGAIVNAGSHAAKLTAGATTNTTLAQTFTVIPGKTYTLSVYARGDGTYSGRYAFYDNTHAVYIKTATTVAQTAAEYANKTFTVIAPPGCLSLIVYLLCPADNTGIAYFDTISFLPTSGLLSVSDSTLGFEMLTNPGFEKEDGTCGDGDNCFGSWTQTGTWGTSTIGRTTTTNEYCPAAVCTTTSSTAALKATYGNTALQTISSAITLVPSQQYTLSFYTRGDATVGGTFGIYDTANSTYLASTGTDCTSAGAALSATAVTSATYTAKSCTFTAPSNATTVTLRFGTPTATGIAYFDDVSLKPVLTAGYLKFDGGKSTAASYDPLISWPSISRVAGLVMFGKYTMPSFISYGGYFGFSSASNVWTQGYGVYQAGATSFGSLGTGNPIIFTTVAGTTYNLATVMKATAIGGCYAFVKDTYWKLLWMTNGGTDATLYPMISNRSQGQWNDSIRVPNKTWLPTPIAYDDFSAASLPSGSTLTTGPDGATQPTTARAWTGGTWSVSGAKAINTPVSSVTNVVVNGTFTTDSDWSKGTDWTIDAADSNVATKAIGAGASLLTASADNLTAGTWYRTSHVVTGYAGSSYCGISTLGTGGSEIGYPTGNTTITGSGRAVGTKILLQAAATAGCNIDNYAAYALTTSELLSSISTSTKDIIISVDVARAATFIQGGVVLNLDSAVDPQNFVIGYIEGSTCKLDKKTTAGGYTSVISASCTYSSGAKLVVVKDDTSYSLYYNNAKVGSTSSITDAGIISNTLHGLFSTSNDITLDNFTIFPRGNNNEYVKLDSLMNTGGGGGGDLLLLGVGR